MLIPNETIRRYININKGVVNAKRDRVYIFINGVPIGTVINHSIEEVFEPIYNTKLVWKVKVEKWANDATLRITLK
jgi:hypothetical protein